MQERSDVADMLHHRSAEIEQIVTSVSTGKKVWVAPVLEELRETGDHFDRLEAVAARILAALERKQADGGLGVHSAAS